MDKTILVVEDEKAIADILIFNLQREGYQTLEANDGRTGLLLAMDKSPDLILLDVMLPMLDGFEVCRQVRKESEVPIIMLTAREEEADKIMGLEIGADDYITKPFSMRELMARIRANMRRVPESKENAEKEVICKNLSISPDRGEVYKNGKPVELTVREYELIRYLSSEPGRIFSREELMHQVWGYEYYGDLRAVDVAIRRLREKIEDNPASPTYIVTKRGMGYYFNADKK